MFFTSNLRLEIEDHQFTMVMDLLPDLFRLWFWDGFVEHYTILEVNYSETRGRGYQISWKYLFSHQSIEIFLSFL